MSAEGVHTFRSDGPILTDMQGPVPDDPIEIFACQICGYQWQRVQRGSAEILIHDLSPMVAGQINYDGPDDVLMERHVETKPRYFRVQKNKKWYEEIPYEEFEEALRRRQNARRGAIRN